MPRITQIPTTQVKHYTPSVPFDKELTIIDEILTSSDLLVPITTKLLIGAKTIYKLTADGINFPTFDSSFVADPLTVEYNKIAGAINVITFEYDGTFFKYSVTSFSGIDLPPYAVADYDLDDTVLVVGAHKVITNMYVNDLAENAGQVSVFDLLSSVHYTGILPLQYKIRAPFYLANAWVTSYNAKDAKILLDCDDRGPGVCDIQVTDGIISSEIITTAFTLQDNLVICGA